MGGRDRRKGGRERERERELKDITKPQKDSGGEWGIEDREEEGEGGRQQPGILNKQTANVFKVQNWGTLVFSRRTTGIVQKIASRIDLRIT